MSYDPKLQNTCDHRINWESYAINTDLRTIVLGHPVSAVRSVSMRISNVLISPSLYTVATVKKPLSLQLTSSIVMQNKVKDWEPFIEVNYLTFANVCPKCTGIKTIDDVVYTMSGDFKMAQKEYLLLQEVEKAIVTDVTSNPFHSWYGTSLKSLIGTKITDLSFIKSKILDQVSSAISKLKNVQKSMVSSGRIVDPGELFGQVRSVTVDQTDDPTIIQVTVVFTAQSGQSLEFSQLMDFSTF